MLAGLLEIHVDQLPECFTASSISMRALAPGPNDGVQPSAKPVAGASCSNSLLMIGSDSPARHREIKTMRTSIGRRWRYIISPRVKTLCMRNCSGQSMVGVRS